MLIICESHSFYKPSDMAVREVDIVKGKSSALTDNAVGKSLGGV
jgi:hypothetical protein